ncbi:helix-turn-helix transcriptional regulator [Actinotalea sp. C106]|uniref:helix-turn-helix transcriptional regulator n=1 Tax=Actinotalea sp. C106 TaxID=2908644 RepID=UPI00202978E6|nr:helix-turn-helix transcriptional regulator [Actinotalea sp. C106]
MSRESDESLTSRRFYRARSLSALATALQGARSTRGLTQDELARTIGSSRPTISRMERAKPASTDTLLDALAVCEYELVVVPRGAVVTVTT